MDYSVITICLNSAQTIGRTIKSVLSQTRLPRQYIFVDGGSTDGTQGVVETCIERSRKLVPRVQIEMIRQRTNGGIANAWNMGLARAKGDVVFILNSDDWYEADCAERAMSCFESERAVDILVGSTRLYQHHQKQMVRTYKSRALFFFPFLNPINHPACFVKRTVYHDIGLYNVVYKVAADYDFLYRCFKAGLKIKRDDAIIVNRQGDGYAERNRAISRVELNQIAKKYCSIPFLSDLALLYRKLTGR